MSSLDRYYLKFRTFRFWIQRILRMCRKCKIEIYGKCQICQMFQIQQKFRNWMPLIWIVIFAVIVLIVTYPVSCYAEEEESSTGSIQQEERQSDTRLPHNGEENTSTESMLNELELESVQQAVDDFFGEDYSLEGMVQELMDGKSAMDLLSWKDLVKDLLWEAIGVQRNGLVQIMLLILLASVFSGFIGALEKKELEQVSFYVTYLLLMAILLKVFQTFCGEIETVLEGSVEFMKALLPSYFLALTAAEGTSTALFFYQMMLGLIYVTDILMLKILLPGIKIFFLVDQVNYLTGEDFLSKMADLIKNGVLWTLKTVAGIIFGIQLIQRLISPAVDALKRTIIGKSASVIPGVGNLFSGITEIVLGSAVLIKNCLGAAAVILMILAAVPPLIRLGVGSVIYQIVAAVVQPIADKRLVGSIHSAGISIGLLLRLLITVEVLFLLTIAILAGALG